MGSGKGKSRRASAAVTTAVQTPAAPGVLMILQAWDSFVRDQGLENVGFAHYYDIKVAFDCSDELAAAPRQSELAKEIFCDLVEMGAIMLPAGVVAEDFDFSVRSVKQSEYSKYEAISLLLLNKKTGVEENCLRYPGESLNDKIKMGSTKMQDLVRWVGSAARRSMEKK